MTLAGLRRALGARAFGTLDVSALSPAYRRSEGALRPAAALVALYDREGEPHVLLTRRRTDLRLHPGQISFPGGSLDPGDADSLAAALREAREEVGLDPDDVEVIGRLCETLVVMTGFRLTPWVGVVPYPYAWAPDPGEVAEVLEVPLAGLARPGAHWTEPREAHGMHHEVHFFAVGAHTVWGATARILFELISLGRQS